MQTFAPDSSCLLTNPQPYQRETDKSRQGVVANTLDLFRQGAVGFIDWLDALTVATNNERSRKTEPSINDTPDTVLLLQLK